MVLYDQSILDDNGKPIFRSKEFDTEDEDHLYGAYDSYDYLFSIKINHGGFFIASPGRIYYHGKEAIVDFIDGDKFSIHEFNHYVKKLGYDSRIVMYYHYLQPDKSDLDVGLKPFACDRDVIKMVSYTKKFKLIEIYIEHAMSTIGDWEYTGESSVVIEDLTEDNETLPNLPKPFIKYKGLHKPFIKPRKSFTRLLLEGPSQESCENDFLGNVNVETPSQEDENLQQKVVKPKPSIVIEDITDDAPANDPIETPTQQCDPTEAVVQDNQNVQDDGDFSQHMDPSDRVNEVEVDMSKFQEHFQRNDEWLKKSVEGGVGNLEINEEVVGIDFDQYDSGEGSQSDGGTIRKKYRKVKRVVTEAGKEEQTSLHLGQAFLCPKQIKELIKSHAVESRRDLKFVKNEPDRIRVRCFGTMPCYKNKEQESSKVVWNGEDQYEVKGPWQDQAVVNTTTKVCSCRKWELTGIPCKHAICAIWNMKDNTRSTQPAQPEDWVHPAYRLETWKEVYSHKINPVTGASTWPISECQLKLLPPHHKTQVGRPSKKRRKAADERVTQSTVTGGRLSRAGKTVTCSKCKKQGHNQRKCKGQSATTSSQPKKSKKPKKKTPSQAEGGVGSSQAGATQTRASASQQAGNQAAGATQTQGSQVEGSQRSNKRKAGDGEGKSKKQQATQRFAS